MKGNRYSGYKEDEMIKVIDSHTSIRHIIRKPQQVSVRVVRRNKEGKMIEVKNVSKKD